VARTARTVRIVAGDARIERWGEGDLELLIALNGDPEQMAHVGGAETAEKIAERQQRYVADPHQFRIVDPASGAGAGWVGFWPREAGGEEIYEIGWSVLPAFQGRGLASDATALALEVARGIGERVAVHAYPGVGNAPSNALCRRVGFVLVQPGLTFEYPPGTKMVCNDWCYALR
jgi:RimJ/RimL family protein N-acetyltransferase